MKTLNRYLGQLGWGAEVTRNELEIDLILPHKLSLSDLACLRKISTSRRKAHHQIRVILADEYGLE